MSLSSSQRAELQQLFGADVAFDARLSEQTTIRIGGPASALVWPKDEAQLIQAIRFAREKELDHFILGKGSNTLFRDGGFHGLVINLTKGFREFKKAKENGNAVWITAQGGVPTQQLVRWAALEGLSGLERLSGVPGTLGGNIVMNAGTALGEIGELVEEIKICDRHGAVKAMNREKLKFEYRSTNLPSSIVVIEATLKLERGDPEKIDKKIREVFEKRGLAQPLDHPNLGSVFKNPGLPAGRQGKKKAWELVEEAGCKGVRIGGARISDKHANFIINEGGATAKDVERLIRMVKDRVKQTCGILLETEVRIVGEER